MRGLAGKRVRVTGGASGIGRATACAADITRDEEVRAAFEAAEGPIERLANVAGMDIGANVLDPDRALWDHVIGSNLYGPLIMHHVVVPCMAERGAGWVVNVASDAGRVGASGEAVHSACESGAIAFTGTMAREQARKGVTLNVPCPGPTDTPLFNGFTGGMPNGDKIGEALARSILLRRLGEPEDYSGLIDFQLSAAAACMPCQTISVSGGLKMA